MSIVRSQVAHAEVIVDESTISVGQWYWYDESKDVLGWSGEVEGEGPQDEGEAFLAQAEADGALEIESDLFVEDEDEDGDEDKEAEEEEDEQPKAPKPPILCCVTDLGSNYVELTEAAREHPSRWRVALPGFDDCCTREDDPQGYIRRQVAARRDNVRELMDEIRRVTAALGVTAPGGVLSDGGASAGTALAAAHAVADIAEHKALLIRTKEEVLPDLFKRVEVEHKAMSLWMKAELLPMYAQLSGMKTVTKAIESRIFTVELYAGLVECCVLIRDGEPAPNDTKVSLFQRRHYMDEECLVNYQAGGMEFGDIGAFDQWLVKPENAGRILPLPRCIVAFRVRRNDKQHEFADWRQFISFLFSGRGDADKRTFLYLRNGERIYRLETKIDFGSRLFPDKDRSVMIGNPGEQLWFDPNRADDGGFVITNSQRTARLEQYAVDLAEWKVKYAAWETKYAVYQAQDERHDALEEQWRAMSWEDRKLRVAALDTLSPEEQDAAGYYGSTDSGYSLRSPMYVSFSGPGEPREPVVNYARLTPSHVYYDDVMKNIKEQADEHNRVAAVIQGILDRSPVFHPHPPWRIFTPEGFAAGIDLVYDDDERVLVCGDPPEFSVYRDLINSRLKLGDVCVGQDHFWEKLEAAKYNKKREDGRNHFDRKTYRPSGDPGPGAYARPVRITKTHAVFKWMREGKRRKRVGGYSWSRRWSDFEDIKVETTLKVPLDQLFNVSGYVTNDYKMFFNDPRTRTAYLQWAPFLLMGEDFAAGKAKV